MVRSMLHHDHQSLPDGPRACRPDELNEVLELANSVMRPDAVQDLRTDYPLVFNAEQVANIRIIRWAGSVASEVPVAPREIVLGADTIRVGIIGPTATRPDCRRRGFGTRCIEDCIELMQRGGLPLSVLWTVPATFPFYQRMGWHPVASQGSMYPISHDDAPRFRGPAVDVAPFEPAATDHLTGVRRIYDAMAHRVKRSDHDCRALFTLPRVRTVIARQGAEVVAYLVVGEARNKSGLIEGGGDKQALAALVARALQEDSRRAIRQAVTVPGLSVLGELLEERLPGRCRPVEEAAGVGHQMMRINSLAGFLGSIRGWLRSLDLCRRMELGCRETGECFAVTPTQSDVATERIEPRETVMLSRAELTALFFGVPETASPEVPRKGWPPEIAATCHGHFPRPFPLHELDHC